MMQLNGKFGEFRRVIVHEEDVFEKLSHYDLMVCALGYETRSSYVPRKYYQQASAKVALAFPNRKLISYQKNQEFLTNTVFDILEYKRETFLQNFSKKLESGRSGDTPLNAIIDVSSMSRPMIAQLIFALSSFPSNRPLQVRFVYCPAKFVAPDPLTAPVTVTEPVIPEFAGWSDVPERPASAIFGLGYEFHQALGTLDYLEPAMVWAFVPHGDDINYDNATAKANKDMYELLEPGHVQQYHIDHPYTYFRTIENLVYGLLQDTRPILIPFGPKIFALTCMLVAQIHSPRVTVWRVSGEQSAEPTDRIASGKIISLSVTFDRL